MSHIDRVFFDALLPAVRAELKRQHPDSTPAELRQRANVTYLSVERVRSGSASGSVSLDELLRLGEVLGMTFTTPVPRRPDGSQEDIEGWIRCGDCGNTWPGTVPDYRVVTCPGCRQDIYVNPPEAV